MRIWCYDIKILHPKHGQNEGFWHLIWHLIIQIPLNTQTRPHHCLGCVRTKYPGGCFSKFSLQNIWGSLQRMFKLLMSRWRHDPDHNTLFQLLKISFQSSFHLSNFISQSFLSTPTVQWQVTLYNLQPKLLKSAVIIDHLDTTEPNCSLHGRVHGPQSSLLRDACCLLLLFLPLLVRLLSSS